MRTSMTIAAFAAAVAAMSAPSNASAQQCADASQCPAGTTCLNGYCQVAPAQPAQPPPGYGAQGTVTVQGQQGGVQVQAQGAVPQAPQQQVYAQPPQQQQQVYAQPQPVQQPQPRTETTHMVGLIVSGAVVLGASWITNIIVSSAAGAGPNWDDWEVFRYLGIVPIVGPWIQMAAIPGSATATDGWYYYLTIQGILQTAGTAMLILGIAIPIERTVYAENGEREGFDLAIAPSPNGLTLSGTF